MKFSLHQLNDKRNEFEIVLCLPEDFIDTIAQWNGRSECVCATYTSLRSMPFTVWCDVIKTSLLKCQLQSIWLIGCLPACLLARSLDRWHHFYYFDILFLKLSFSRSQLMHIYIRTHSMCRAAFWFATICVYKQADDIRSTDIFSTFTSLNGNENIFTRWKKWRTRLSIAQKWLAQWIDRSCNCNSNSTRNPILKTKTDMNDSCIVLFFND